MAKNPPRMANVDDAVDAVVDGADIDVLADTLVARGRAVVDRVPAAADGAREALADAQETVNQLSDMGVVAALGFAPALSRGLWLASARIIRGAPSPVAITLRSALSRGVRPAGLVN